MGRDAATVAATVRRRGSPQSPHSKCEVDELRGVGLLIVDALTIVSLLRSLSLPRTLKRRWRCYTSGGEAPRSSLMRTLRRLALSTLTAPSSRHRLRKPTRVRLPLA